MQIVIYTKPSCHSCSVAKNTLDKLSIPYQAYEIGDQVTLDEIKEKFPNARTVPIITIDGHQVQGISEVVRKHNGE